MNKKLKKFFRLENIPVLLAFAISFGFLIYDLFQPTPEVALRVVIIVLGTLALGLLSDRIGIFERIDRTLSDLKAEKESFLNTPTDWTDFEIYCNVAEEIFISGGSLGALVPRYRKLFEELANDGCKLRFLLLNPNNPALESVSAWAGKSHLTLKGEIELSLANLNELTSICKDNIEVRLNNTISALTVMGFDTSKPNGKIRVDLNLYQCPAPSRLYFELTRTPNDSQEENWFEIFLSQFENQWSDAERWKGYAQN